jgi:hypothetical protein
MTNKHFEAILAKNNIAREIRDSERNNEPISTSFIKNLLKDIEAYTGEGNQPSVEDIINCQEYDL